jgi:hypothetical protein
MDVKVHLLIGGDNNQKFVYKVFTDLSDNALKLELLACGYSSQSICYPILAQTGAPKQFSAWQDVRGEELVAAIQATYADQNLQLSSEVLTMPEWQTQVLVAA